VRKSRRQRRQDKPARQSPQPPPPAVHAGRGAVALALVTFAVVFAVLDVASYTKTSATWDEPIHIAAGYAALTQHDYRVDPEHPPFLRMWAALPLLAMDGIKLDTGAIDRAEPNVWALTTLLNFCHRFLYVDNDGDRLLYSARFMIVLLGWTLGVLIFYWVDEWLGFWPAVVALALYTFEPNIEAHSSLVTTDFGAACFMFGAVYFLWRTCQRWSIANLVGLVVFFVLAIASKFSAMILGPIVALLLAISALRFRLLNVRTAVGILVLLACSAWIGIWAIYGFRHAPSSSSSWLFHLQDSRLVQQRVPDLAQLIAWVDDHHLLPNVFSQGFLIGQAKAQERSAFLAGSYSNTGWWYYFPVAFLIKTPLSAIILALGGAVLCVARWRSASQRTAFLLVPIAVYLAAAMGSHINIGLRHILPIYPFADRKSVV